MEKEFFCSKEQLEKDINQDFKTGPLVLLSVQIGVSLIIALTALFTMQAESDAQQALSFMLIGFQLWAVLLLMISGFGLAFFSLLVGYSHRLYLRQIYFQRLQIEPGKPGAFEKE